MMQWLRTVALACAVARAAAVVVIDGTTPSCALTTSEIGQLCIGIRECVLTEAY